MFQFAGVTYRIDRVGKEYEIVRLLDDVTIGSFRESARTAVVRDPEADEPSIRSIACAAIRQGKTLWKPAHSVNPGALRLLAQQLALIASR